MYQPNPPVLNIVPVGLIAGEVNLTREQSDRQVAIGRSMYLCQGNGFCTFVGIKYYHDDSLMVNHYWLVAWVDEAARLPGYWTETASAEERLAFVKNMVKDIHPDYKEIFDLQKPEKMINSFVFRDRVPEPCPAGPVTLIGDASHPMTACLLSPLFIFFRTLIYFPVRGEGANSAMQDAIQLADKLADAKSAGTPYVDALKSYEALMIPRATTSVLESREATAMLAGGALF